MNTLSLGGSPSRFLALGEAARLLGTSESQGEALIDSGELPAIRLGENGPWRVSQLVLDSYIDSLYERSRRHRLWNGSNSASIEHLP